MRKNWPAHIMFLAIGYVVCMFVFLTNIFVYPGYLSNTLKINPANFFVIFVVIGGYDFLFTSIRPRGIITTFFNLNRWLVLPIGFVASTVFGLMEVLHYPNYVFATIGIHYYDFLYVFFVAYLVELLHLGRQSVFAHFKRHFLIFGGILIYMFVAISFWSNSLDTRLSREGGFFENSQFFLYLLSGVVTVYFSKTLFQTRKFLSIIYLILGLLFLFIAGEEVSWGQRVFELITPDWLKSINDQDEITIHNISFINDKQYLAYMLLGYYGVFSWLVNALNSSRGFVRKFHLLMPPAYLGLFFLPVFLYNAFYFSTIGSYHALSEFSEFMLALGVFLFVILGFRNIDRRK
jgi:hypothetical protein